MLIVVITGSCIYGCGYAGSTASPNGYRSAPTVGAISPNTALAGGAAFTLTITGTNFVAASVVNFGGAAPSTTFVSSTQLTAAIPAASIASVGTVAVTVTNPAPGGSTSNAVNFMIESSVNPVPTIASLSPSCAPAGEQVLNPNINGQLLINGQNFGPSSVVRWNGNDRPTTFFPNTGQLAAQVSASDLATAGTATVTVFNPSEGSSNSSTFTITTGGIGPASITVDPAGKFAYVANQGCGDSTFGNIAVYTIDATTGALSSVGPPVSTGDEDAWFVTVDPSGKFVYVGNSGAGDTAGSISAFTINEVTGALTSLGLVSSNCSECISPRSLAVTPSDKFLYAAYEGSFSPTIVATYAINGTSGLLSAKDLIRAGGRAFSVTVEPMGKFAYVASQSDPGLAGNISMYAINASTGVLTSIGTTPAGIDPDTVVVDPTGKFIYVTNSTDLLMYSIDMTSGNLTSIGTLPGATGIIVIHPSGKFAYVSNSSGTFAIYMIDPTKGTLTSVGTTGTASGSISIHPSGKFAYVTDPVSNTVSTYSIDTTTGSLTLVGTVGT